MSSAEQRITPDGVVVFGPLIGSGGAEITATATDSEGTPIEGVLALSSEAEGVWVFRPADPVPPGTLFTVVASSPGQWECFWGSGAEGLQISVTVEEATFEAPDAPTYEATIGAWGSPSGRVLCCDEDGDSCGPYTRCRGEQTRQLPRVEWTPIATPVDPAVANSFVRQYFPAAPSASDELLAYEHALDGGKSFYVSYPEPADAYCIRIDTINVVDDSRTSQMVCVDDPGEDWSTDDNDLDAFAEGCSSGAYWEDDDSPYTEEAETEGGSSSTGGDEEPGGPLITGGDESGTGGGAPAASEPGEQGCRTVEGTPTTWIGLMVIGFSVVRRRH